MGIGGSSAAVVWPVHKLTTFICCWG